MALQRMGFTYIAIGGLARVPMTYVLATLEEVSRVRRPSTRLHLLGVTRPGAVRDLARLGVYSFDSSAPLRQAFLNESDNYHTAERTYLALRLPQATSNRELRERISRGEVRARTAFDAERSALQALRDFDAGRADIDEALERVCAYERLFNGRDQTAAYRETLEARPWEQCGCACCEALGVEIVVLRGKQRNNRRGFHNLRVFFHKLETAIGAEPS